MKRNWELPVVACCCLGIAYLHRIDKDLETAARQKQRSIQQQEDIRDLLNDHKIEIHVRGSGIEEVLVGITWRAPSPAVPVRIPAATLFVSSNPTAQNMVTTEERTVTLIDKTGSVYVPTACANRSRKIPADVDTFTIEHLPQSSELATLVRVLKDKARDFSTKQAAVWIVTDNANYGDLGILHRDGLYSSERAITEREAAFAMKICDEAGINITKKAIWKDRQSIFLLAMAGTDERKDPALMEWIRRKRGS